jgi:hypothetical protein
VLAKTIFSFLIFLAGNENHSNDEEHLNDHATSEDKRGANRD